MSELTPEEMPLNEALRIARKGANDYKDVPSVSRTLLARIAELERKIENNRVTINNLAEASLPTEARQLKNPSECGHESASMKCNDCGLDFRNGKVLPAPPPNDDSRTVISQCRTALSVAQGSLRGVLDIFPQVDTAQHTLKHVDRAIEAIDNLRATPEPDASRETFLHEVIRDMRVENRLHGHITDATAKYLRKYPERARDVVTPEMTSLDAYGKPAPETSEHLAAAPSAANSEQCESRKTAQSGTTARSSLETDAVKPCACWDHCMKSELPYLNCRGTQLKQRSETRAHKEPPCDCTQYNGRECSNCLNGAHSICKQRPKCQRGQSLETGEGHD